jgi:hypothetical protein
MIWLYLFGGIVFTMALAFACFLPVAVYLWSPHSPRNRR